ncbi:MAG: type II secretion system F family protein [Phycisphaerae bacterium]|nr:type II secretion system F family protein [Phycisphaerae bacterium]
MNFLNTENLYISVLVFMMVFSIGGVILVLHKHKQKKIESKMLGILEDDPFHKETKSGKGFLAFLVKVGNIVSHGRSGTALWEQMIQAGYLNAYAPTIYMGVKLLLFVIGLVAGSLLVMVLSKEMDLGTKLMIIFLGGTLFFFLPNIVIVSRLRKRHDEIYRNLPQAIDLLEICVSSGLGLDMAWNIVADEVRQVSSVLSGSMSLTNFEMHLGVSRIDAMKHMADRTGVDDLKSLAAILIQTDRFGTSIADTLRIFAQSIREERSFAAEEAAEKMGVKLLIPMILFIFPATLLVMVGPAVISLTNALQQ